MPLLQAPKLVIMSPKLLDMHYLLDALMSTIDHPALYDDLLEKNRAGTLTDEESAELDAYERFEHLVRLLKARVLQKQSA